MNNLLKNMILFPFNLLYKISPEMDLKLLFLIKNGYKLNMKNPITYNEKLQWIKLYDKNRLMPICCDKYTVREYVESKNCANILNEVFWDGFNPEEIPFEELPEQFVIKVTHGSTFNIICINKKELDINKTKKILKKWLKAKFLPCYGEWFYGKVKPRIIVEKYLQNPHGSDLLDYKVFCFNGEPKYIDIHSERFNGHKRDFFDIDWKRLNGYRLLFANSSKSFQKPVCYNEMLEYARVLSKDFYHARVDFYIIDNKPVFGEITFTNGAGFDKFEPYEFDVEMGSCLKLDAF